MKLSLLNHYDLSLTADGKAYQFTTDTGEVYIAYFTEFTLGNTNGEDIIITSFGFEKSTASKNEKERYDAKVKATIQFIIKEFFDKFPDSGVLYLCLNNDERARNRHITFSKWFHELGDAYEKYDSPSIYREDGFYSSLVLKSLSSRKKELREAFYHTIEYWMKQ